MCMCGKCTKLSGLVVLIAGIALLLVDLGVWTFWGVKWSTVAFLLLGLGTLGAVHCPECKIGKKK